MIQVHGLIPIHKPLGMVSKDVSRWLTARIGKVKLGHVGTLDPLASGVLPVVFGRATKLQDYLLELDKAYEFEMQFGQETDSLDLDGVVVREAPYQHITKAAIEAALPSLHGPIRQIPPLHSAVKFQGRPLYDYVRSGKGDAVPVADLGRDVHIHSIKLLSFQANRATIQVSCSKGTYVRVLAKDLADKLGSCATLTRLVRTQAAGISLVDCISLEDLETRLSEVESLVIPVASINLGLPEWQGDERAVARLKTGQTVILDITEWKASGMNCDTLPSLALKDCDNRLYGLGVVRRFDAGRVEIAMKRGI